MASRCCGSRLSLPNQYDTKNPARETLGGGRWQPRCSMGPVRCPSRYRLGKYSRHEYTSQRGFRKYPEKISKISRKKNFEKFLRSARPPDPALRTPAKVFENVTSGKDKPQAVLWYRSPTCNPRSTLFVAES